MHIERDNSSVPHLPNPVHIALISAVFAVFSLALTLGSALGRVAQQSSRQGIRISRHVFDRVLALSCLLVAAGHRSSSICGKARSFLGASGLRIAHGSGVRSSAKPVQPESGSSSQRETAATLARRRAARGNRRSKRVDCSPDATFGKQRQWRSIPVRSALAFRRRDRMAMSARSAVHNLRVSPLP